MVEEEKMRTKLGVLNQEYSQVKSHIETLVKERVFDQLLLQRLKKRKLQLKDQITYLRESLCDDIIA